MPSTSSDGVCGGGRRVGTAVLGHGWGTAGTSLLTAVVISKSRASEIRKVSCTGGGHGEFRACTCEWQSKGVLHRLMPELSRKYNAGKKENKMVQVVWHFPGMMNSMCFYTRRWLPAFAKRNLRCIKRTSNNGKEGGASNCSKTCLHITFHSVWLLNHVNGLYILTTGKKKANPKVNGTQTNKQKGTWLVSGTEKHFSRSVFDTVTAHPEQDRVKGQKECQRNSEFSWYW